MSLNIQCRGQHHESNHRGRLMKDRIMNMLQLAFFISGWIVHCRPFIFRAAVVVYYREYCGLDTLEAINSNTLPAPHTHTHTQQMVSFVNKFLFVECSSGRKTWASSRKPILFMDTLLVSHMHDTMHTDKYIYIYAHYSYYSIQTDCLRRVAQCIFKHYRYFLDE